MSKYSASVGRVAPNPTMQNRCTAGARQQRGFSANRPAEDTWAVPWCRVQHPGTPNDTGTARVLTPCRHPARGNGSGSKPRCYVSGNSSKEIDDETRHAQRGGSRGAHGEWPRFLAEPPKAARQQRALRRSRDRQLPGARSRPGRAVATGGLGPALMASATTAG